MRLIKCNSPVASTWEWLASICSINVEPDLGKPTTKIGLGSGLPPTLNADINLLSQTATESSTLRVLSEES